MNAPTLLVGLGGTGCKIVERVSKMVTAEQRGSISCAVFDTDINDLREIQKKNPFIKTIQTSTNQTVGEYLNKDTHARDSWFPVNAILNGKTLTEGAGQVRSISRLALETVIRAGKMEPLHEAIQNLYKVEEDKAEQALRVVIVSSLAGGTGSGLILPVALYIRNYLKTHFRQSANITRGFFILPEVFYEVITGQSERNNLRANAYATLRELDAFLMKGDDTLPERYKNSVRISYIRLSSRKKEHADDDLTEKYRKLKESKAILIKIKSLSRAYHLDIDFSSKLSDDIQEVSAISLKEDLFMIEAGEPYEIEINKSGLTALSPFSFTDRLEILREELYDDKRH